MTEFVIGGLSFLTLISNVFLALLLFVFLGRKTKVGKIYWSFFIKTVKTRGILFAFLVALVATSGSLYFSEVAGFEPCKLCWFQRIFMYPQTIILGVALIKKTRDVVFYAMPLALVGGLLAIYHYVLQMSANPWAPCSTIGFSVSCSERFVAEFGYITIPWMSFSAFLLIFFFLSISAKNEG